MLQLSRSGSGARLRSRGVSFSDSAAMATVPVPQLSRNNIPPCGMIFYSSEIVGPSDGNARSKEPLFKHFAKITLNI